MSVRIYRNITRDCWSIAETGQKVRHASAAVLQDAFFHVGEGGRLRVLATKRKNVHAWVRGALVPGYGVVELRRVTYNPYRNTTLVWADSGAPVHSAHLVFFSPEGYCYATSTEATR